MSKIRVGISACLLGHNTRYDGHNKGAAEFVAALEKDLEWLPLCPETDAGLGVPRPPIDLYRQEDGRIAVITPQGLDCTAQLEAWIATALPKLRHAALDGLILKARSPSCGIASAKLRIGGPNCAEADAAASAADAGKHKGDCRPAPIGTTDGLFVAALKRALPNLPLVEDEELRDAAQRELFLQRVRAHRRQRRQGALWRYLSLLFALLLLPRLLSFAWPVFGRQTSGCVIIEHPFALQVLVMLGGAAVVRGLLCRRLRRPWPWRAWLWTALGAWIALLLLS
jgi:uncharacterized protein YbbK (DUF523 family)